jgi:DNA modification methylase
MPARSATPKVRPDPDHRSAVDDEDAADGGSVADRRSSAPFETGVIYRGENLEWMRQFPDESVDLAYLDPPFFSNRQYEVIWGEEAEVRSFEDRWAGGIHVYIDWMRERMVEAHRLLKPTGSLWLHCDPTASHYLKVMLDEVFGRERFLGEVIWKRTSAHSSANRPGPVHDVLLVYSRGDRHTWNKVYQPYDESYLSEFYTHVDADMRRWRRSDLTGAGTRKGETGLPWRGIDVTAKGRHWAYPPSVLEEMNAAGRVHWPAKRGGMPMYKRYADQMAGVPAQDVWTDIPPLHNLSKERIGYPTQKPLALLARIIELSTNPGDVVFDPFCGCGTSVVAAASAGRRWAGVDISRTACRLIADRMADLGIAVQVKGMDESEDTLRALKPFEFQNWVVERMHGTHAPRPTGDGGVDGYSFLLREPIQVKQQDGIDRPVVDEFETAVGRSGGKVGYIVAFSFSRGATAEAARARREHGLDIRLVRVSDLLAEPENRPRHVPAITRPVIRLRPREAKPTAAELISSERAERVREEYARRVAEGEAAYEPSPEAPPSPHRSKRGQPVPQPLRESGDTD